MADTDCTVQYLLRRDASSHVSIEGAKKVSVAAAAARSILSLNVLYSTVESWTWLAGLAGLIIQEPGQARQARAKGDSREKEAMMFCGCTYLHTVCTVLYYIEPS